ncbi:MAG TPA: DUF1501 domain-containing protein [Planctomycetota bacterium]|nr:DUF1501 domain-containing protein [Planctomycetota bacterium]
MNEPRATPMELTRRALLGRGAHGIGSLALGSLLPGLASSCATGPSSRPALPPPRGFDGLPHFAPRARRVLCLFQAGGLSHIDLFDDKPTLHEHAGQDLPPSVRGSQRLTGMTSGQSKFPVVPPIAGGRRCGQSGLWISNLLPHLQTTADELCLIKSLYTEAINHDPAITLLNTGNQLPGYASMGSWVAYGLGSENENLPSFLTMVSQGSGKNPGQPIFSRLWGSGFLPSSQQGVALRPGGNPVLHLANPDGIDRAHRRAMLDDLAELQALGAERSGDPETTARIAAGEMAFRMQASVPELLELRGESAAVLASYGPDVQRPGSYAANCLLARRLLERGVRFVQLFHRGWDQHIAITRQLPDQCRDFDQPTAAVIADLRQRGMLDDTLVVIATEFGRTVYSQGELGAPGAGRDHHGRCFTIALAGGGVRGGIEYGATDDFCYNIAADPVHVRDLHATMLHCLGVDHARFTYRFRGLDTKLTGVEPARVVTEVLA